MFLFNNCLLVYFNGDPPTARPPPPPPPLLPRGGLDGEEAGGGTSHSPLPPGTAAAAGPRAGGGRAGAKRGPGAATAPRRCRSAELGLLRAPPAGTMAAARSREPPPRHPNRRERGREKQSPSPSQGETLAMALCCPSSEKPRSQAGPEQSALLRFSVAHIRENRETRRGDTVLFPFIASGGEKKKNRVSCISLMGARGVRCRFSLGWRTEYVS